MGKKQMFTTPLRLPPDLKDWAKAEAAAKELSLNAFIVNLLEELRKKSQLEK